MAIWNTGDWPCDATTTTGTDLADRLSRLVDALDTQHANTTRPGYIKAGGVWTQTVPAGGYKLYFFDGTKDHEIGSVSATGTAQFGGGAPLAPAFSATATYTTGQIIYDPATGGYLQAKNAVAAGPYNPGDWQALTNLFGAFVAKAGDTMTGDLTISRAVGENSKIVLRSGTGAAHIQQTDANLSLINEAAGNFQIGTNNTPQVSVIAGGAFTVGTGAQQEKLTVTGDANNGSIAVVSDAVGWPIRKIRSDGSSMIGLYNYDGYGGMEIYAGGSARMRFDQNGKIYSNTNNMYNGGIFGINMDGHSNGIEVSHGGGGSIYHLVCRNSTGMPGGVRTDGNTCHFDNLSDERFKENLTPVTGHKGRIASTKVYDYTYKKTGQLGRGVIAQEAVHVDPIPVSVGSPDEADMNDPTFMPWAVDYSKYVPDLIACVQDLMKENADMKARLAKLEARP